MKDGVKTGMIFLQDDELSKLSYVRMVKYTTCNSPKRWRNTTKLPLQDFLKLVGYISETGVNSYDTTIFWLKTYDYPIDDSVYSPTKRCGITPCEAISINEMVQRVRDHINDVDPEPTIPHKTVMLTS